MLGRQRGRSVVARVTSAAQGWVQTGQGHLGHPGKVQAARSVWTGVAGHGHSVRGRGVPYLPGSPAGGSFTGVGVRRGARGGRSSRTSTVHGPRRSHAARGPVWAPGGACAPCLLAECSVILRPALWVSQLLVPSPSNICKESRGFCTVASLHWTAPGTDGGWQVGRALSQHLLASQQLRGGLLCGGAPGQDHAKPPEPMPLLRSSFLESAPPQEASRPHPSPPVGVGGLRICV